MKTLVMVSIMFYSTVGFSSTWTNGYVRKNGTVVQGYSHSEPDKTEINNYSYHAPEAPVYHAPHDRLNNGSDINTLPKYEYKNPYQSPNEDE